MARSEDDQNIRGLLQQLLLGQKHINARLDQLGTPPSPQYTQVTEQKTFALRLENIT